MTWQEKVRTGPGTTEHYLYLHSKGKMRESRQRERSQRPQELVAQNVFTIADVAFPSSLNSRMPPFSIFHPLSSLDLPRLLQIKRRKIKKNFLQLTDIDYLIVLECQK